MKKVVQFPGNSPDVCEMMLDGKPEIMLSARGVVMLALCGWKEDRLEESLSAMRRYCEYIAMHGYQGGARAAMAELENMDKEAAKEWIIDTFALYVKDQMSIIQYIFNGWEVVYHG